MRGKSQLRRKLELSAGNLAEPRSSVVSMFTWALPWTPTSLRMFSPSVGISVRRSFVSASGPSWRSTNRSAVRPVPGSVAVPASTDFTLRKPSVPSKTSPGCALMANSSLASGVAPVGLVSR